MMGILGNLRIRLNPAQIGSMTCIACMHVCVSGRRCAFMFVQLVHLLFGGSRDTVLVEVLCCCFALNWRGNGSLPYSGKCKIGENAGSCFLCLQKRFKVYKPFLYVNISLLYAEILLLTSRELQLATGDVICGLFSHNLSKVNDPRMSCN